MVGEEEPVAVPQLLELLPDDAGKEGPNLVIRMGNKTCDRESTCPSEGEVSARPPVNPSI